MIADGRLGVHILHFLSLFFSQNREHLRVNFEDIQLALI